MNKKSVNTLNDKTRFLKFNRSLALVMIGAWLFIISCGTNKDASPTKKDEGDLTSEDSTSKSIDAPADSSRLPYFIDEILDDLAEGRIAFNAPDSVVELDQSFTIQLLLDPAKTVDELETMIRASGPTESHQIKISENMQARLTGNGFEITAITPEEQLISARETTEWKWEVKAVKPGSQRLYLTLSAMIKFQGETKSRAIRTFEREMLVTVSLRKRVLTFLGKNWQWLWTALIVPVMGWLWRRRSAKKRAKR
jgi:hypothetical protein